jgi:hypothetical protein
VSNIFLKKEVEATDEHRPTPIGKVTKSTRNHPTTGTLFSEKSALQSITTTYL